ncbi:MAG: cytochrome D1 domain-containing protein [Gammaproteobacteria bacterium]|nr:cytochrome D1 domain-containing protein [Gammaproteobacteria bacterium]
MRPVSRHASGLALLLAAISATSNIDAAERLYEQHCAACHGTDRLGGSGPALVPGNFERLDREAAMDVIRDGRPATQMPAFGGKLSAAEVESLADYIFEPPPAPPEWTLADMQHSHSVPTQTLADAPVYAADPLNLFLIVEKGDHHITILDGDRLEPIHRFATHRALHGGPKFSPDGRFTYLASRDGWISKYDLYGLEVVAEIRAGINTRNLAVSGDGRYVLVGNYLPHQLVMLDAGDLAPLAVIPVTGKGDRSSRVSAVYDAPARSSFVVALKDMAEIWEIPYGDDREPVYPGLVHDYRYAEGIADDTRFPVRRIRLDHYLDDLCFSPDYRHVIGTARDTEGAQVINLDVGRRIAGIDLPGLPHLASCITWQYKDRTVMATPDFKAGMVSVIDVETWQVIRRIETAGPGFFMRSHEATPYAWVDVFFGPDNDRMHIIDKNSLEIVRTLVPTPGATSAHVEFDRHGRYALVSVWENEGAVVIYDAHTLEEIKRLPMRRPSGKYNVYNRISGSTGTSH